MLLHPHRIVCALALLAFVLGVHPARGDDAESVKKRLAEAKKVYTDKAEKFRKAVTEHLDKREADARKAGNKKLLDQTKAERTALEDRGELPPGCPPALLTQMRTARADLNAAFAAAVKGYLLLKDDTAAEATEQEQQQFALNAALLFGKKTYLVALQHYDVKAFRDWFTNDGTQADKKDVKYKLNGELVPHSINMVPPTKGTAQVKYPLGGKWTAFRATVGVPKIEDAAENPASALTFEVLGDGKSLWKSEPVTKLDEFQTCAVSVEKVKVLTLLIHAAGRYYWARSVWFEPVLIE
jgi:hypothetical protein